MMSNSLQPVGQPVELQLQAFNLDRLQDQMFQCAVRVGSKEFISPAEVKVEDSALSARTLSCWFTFDYEEELAQLEAPVILRWQEWPDRTVDMTSSINLTLYKCTVGRVDCSLCLAVKASLNCSWCDNPPRCLHKNSCQAGLSRSICPAPNIRSIEPTLGPMEGGTQLTVYGSNLGQKFEDVKIILVAGVYCTPIRRLYNISTRVVCETSAKGLKDKGSVSITVAGKETVMSTQLFTYKDPRLGSFWPREGPEAGGTLLTIRGHNLNIGNDVEVFLGKVACRVDTMTTESIVCETGMVAEPTMSSVTVQFGTKATRLLDQKFEYIANPIIYGIKPQVSFFSGGRNVSVEGDRLNSVQHPIMAVRLLFPAVARSPRGLPAHADSTADMAEGKCSVKNTTFMMCLTPNATPVMPLEYNADVPAEVIFVLDGLHLSMANRARFTYLPDPTFNLLSRDANSPHNYKPGSPITAEGAGLDRAMQQDEVTAFLGDKECDIKTLTRTHLYCQPPAGLPPGKQHKFRVVMGNLKFDLGYVIYADEPVITFPLEAQIAAGVGSALLILAVVIIVVIYRRKSKRALRNYMKVQTQLENLEITVRDQCKKQFSDLMTEMEDLSSDLFVTGIPFLDYKTYLERIFFPGQRNPMGHDLEVPVGRKHTVEQGLQLLSNLLCSKPFLTTFIHTLEAQPRVTARDRGHVASLLTVALYDKLEYYTDILRTLVSDLVAHYVARNPKLMLRRTETVAEKMLTNWMSICLHGFLKERAGEPLFLLFRAIKQQVEKGPVDAILRKAKYSLNDTRLLGDDVDYHGMVLNATVENSGEDGPTVVRVLDCDTISQVKEKILDQVYRNVPFSQRPQVDAVDLEWHSPTARHFTLSDEDRTSASQGCWKRINTLRHYEIQEGATMFLVPSSPENQMNPHPYRDMTVAACMESVSDEEDCVRKWHLVKGVEEADTMAMRKGSEQERGQGKVIAEIYLTRLLSMKGILQNFVDGLFSMVLNAHGSVPLAVKYFFDFLDEEAERHGVADQETLHIWKTNSLPLRFWVNIIKNPQFVFDIQVSDIVDSALTVIAQTFMDSCTTVDQKLGRDSPINKLLYAREIPRYKKMVEKYFVDVRQMAPVSDQEMNTALTDEARNHGHELKPMVALHELYKYISKYYEQIITALEVDPIAQKMQLSYRLQQVAAALEHKVTDL
uniref:IPT/TIG domain-containing protein n=1 Tax=Eptatretus burgeri TaxID=7764 RepID=A0A8C4QW75_EPTBU